VNRDRRVRIYDAHSWTGISLGLFLFVICFTGSLAMFYHEIKSWEDPARRLALTETPVPVQPLVDAWLADVPHSEIGFVGVDFPNAYEPYYYGRFNHVPENGQSALHERRWNATTGEVLPERGDGLATWLLDFHRDLMWPEFLGGRQIGRGIVGIAGIVMLLSIVTGILTHRKIFKEFFTFRRERSVRVKWKDAHNFLGIWSLPFSITIAFTGAWLGIVALLLPITGMLVFKGDSESVVNLLTGGEPARTEVEAPMLSLDRIKIRPHSESGALPVSVFASNWGDETAEYTVNYPPDTELYYYEVERVRATTGEALPLTGLLEPAASTRVIAAISPLHYGTYGGIALKFLYFALGIGLSAMVALGNMVWIERRAHSAEGGRSPRFYDRLSRLTAGVCMGVVLASVAIFYVDAFYVGAEDDRIFWIGISYFAAWFSALAFAFVAANSYRATRALLAASGAGLVGLPVASALASGIAPWSLLAAGHHAAPAVDLTLMTLGIVCLWVASRLPSRRGGARATSGQPATSEPGALSAPPNPAA